MPDPAGATDAAVHSQWRNPVFLLVFVPGALAWLAVVGWFTWLYVNPVMGWVGGLNEIAQELVGLVILLAWALALAFGIGGVGMLAERIAGIRPGAAGQTHGKHAGWRRPHSG